LYSICHDTPVKEGGGEGISIAEQELNVQKWSILWRTIALSAMDKTIYPYCKYLRMLDLRDLGSLLEDDKFRGKTSKYFFEGVMSRFHQTIKTPANSRFAPRLDRHKIISELGDEITQKTPLVEILSEPQMTSTLSSALLKWAPRLGQLRTLDLWDGKLFADETMRNLLHSHCPNLESLTVYHSSNHDVDHGLATFISGMPENKLKYLQVLGDSVVGAETCLALNHHASSLATLILHLGDQGILSLALLKDCTALVELSVGSDRGHIVDLKATQNDVYLEIVEWLKTCTALKKLELRNIISAPDIVTPLLLSDATKLEDLSVFAGKDECM
jgi:hypothetical protein